MLGILGALAVTIGFVLFAAALVWVNDAITRIWRDE